MRLVLVAHQLIFLLFYIFEFLVNIFSVAVESVTSSFPVQQVLC